MKRCGLLLALVLASTPLHAQQAEVATAIRGEADKFIAAIASADIDKFCALFTEDADFIYVDAGRIYPDRPALRAAGAGFFRRIKTFNATWDSVKVIVQGPDGGTFTGKLRVQSATDTAGVAIWPNGKIWTLAYQRRGGRWQIIQANEANVPAPRSPR